MTHFSDSDALSIPIPITKSTVAEDGSVLVEGLCTDDGLDLDSQRIDKDFAQKGLEAWFRDWANVRQQHSSNLPPAGKAVSMEKRADGVWIQARIVEPTAVKLVQEDVYKAFSVGISKPRIIRDPDGIAKNGIVIDGIFSEVSIVDYPANPRAKFQLAKRASSGEVEIVEKAVDVELTKAVPTPADVFGRFAAAAGDLADELAKRNIPQAEREKIPAADFAGPDKSYPIAKPEDVAAAAHLVGKADDPAAVKARIIAIAHRKGAEFVAQLPESWTKEDKAADAETTPVEPELTKSEAPAETAEYVIPASLTREQAVAALASINAQFPDVVAKHVATAGIGDHREPEGDEDGPDIDGDGDGKGGKPQAEHAPADEDAAGHPVKKSEEPEATAAEPVADEPAVTKGFDADLVKSFIETRLGALRDELTKAWDTERSELIGRIESLEKSPDPAQRAYRGAPLAALRPQAGEAAAGRGDAMEAEVLKSLILKARKDVAGPAAAQVIEKLGAVEAAKLIFEG